MSTRSETPSLIGTATLWCTPTPYCADGASQGGNSGDGLVFRVRAAAHRFAVRVEDQGGNIGQALASYQGFERDGFKVAGIFDSNPKFQSYSVRGVKIEDVENLTRVFRERQIDIGVICTPASVAQEVADQLVLGGVKGIWNFAPTELIVPEHVILVHEHLTRGLLTLSYHITQRYGVESNPEMAAQPETAETPVPAEE